MTEFEAAMASACESTLKEVLGLSGFASTVYRLSMNGVSLRDCAGRPADFDDFLAVLFNPVEATFVEGRILKRFYSGYLLRQFRWGDGLNFVEEVKRAREAFEDQFNTRGAQHPTPGG